MVKIVLLCSGGMSTSLLANKMNEYADSIGFEAKVSAHGIAQALQYGSDADLILIAPQSRFNLSTVKKQLPNKLVDIIDMRAYGMMDGKAVMTSALKILEA